MLQGPSSTWALRTMPLSRTVKFTQVGSGKVKKIKKTNRHGKMEKLPNFHQIESEVIVSFPCLIEPRMKLKNLKISLVMIHTFFIRITKIFLSLVILKKSAF